MFYIHHESALYISVFIIPLGTRRSLVTSPSTESQLSSVYPLNSLASSTINESARTEGERESPDDTRITDPWELSHKLLHKLIVTLKGKYSTHIHVHVPVCVCNSV